MSLVIFEPGMAAEYVAPSLVSSATLNFDSPAGFQYSDAPPGPQVRAQAHQQPDDEHAIAVDVEVRPRRVAVHLELVADRLVDQTHGAALLVVEQRERRPLQLAQRFGTDAGAAERQATAPRCRARPARGAWCTPGTRAPRSRSRACPSGNNGRSRTPPGSSPGTWWRSRR